MNEGMTLTEEHVRVVVEDHESLTRVVLKEQFDFIPANPTFPIQNRSFADKLAEESSRLEHSVYIFKGVRKPPRRRKDEIPVFDLIQAVDGLWVQV